LYCTLLVVRAAIQSVTTAGDKSCKPRELRQGEDI